jgi:uncharacterized protein (TIRG00374 family)
MPAVSSETQAEQEPGRPALGRGALVALAVGLPISAALLAEAVRGTNLDDVSASLQAASPIGLLAAVLAMGAVYVLQAARWRFIARQYGDLPLPTALTYVIGGVAINNVVPGRPGELARAYWLSSYLHIPGAKGLATVIVDRAADVVTLTACLAVTYAFVPHPAWARNVALAAVAVGGAVLVALVACRWYVTRRQRSGKGIPERFRALWMVRQVAMLVRGAASIVTARGAVVIGGLSIAAWACWALAAYLTAASLSIHLSPAEALFVTAIVNLGVSIPSSPGFIGTYQWLCVSALGLFSVDRGDAFAFAVLMHAVWFVPTTIAGLVLLVRTAAIRHRRRQPITAALGGLAPR